jgi:uncharacterized membrane protein YidH (DUF202 family)
MGRSLRWVAWARAGRIAWQRCAITLLLAGVAASAVFLALLSFELCVRRSWFDRAVLGRKRS